MRVTAQKQYTVSTNVPITLEFRNRSGRDIRLVPHGLMIHVWDESGVKVPGRGQFHELPPDASPGETAIAERDPGRRIRLSPSKSWTWPVNLGGFFNFEKGKYRLRIQIPAEIRPSTPTAVFWDRLNVRIPHIKILNENTANKGD